MKQVCRKLSLLFVAAAFIAPVSVLAQKDEKIKEEKKKEKEEIIILRKGENMEKVTVEINGEKILVNGKPLEDLKGDDVTVRRVKVKDAWAYAEGMNKYNNLADMKDMKMDFFNNFNGNLKMNIDSNRAMLGVTTEKAETGVSVTSVTKESAAAKAGIKEDDIITKIDDQVINTPDDLSAAVRKHKAGENVNITLLRDKKENKLTAALGKWKGASIFKYDNNGEQNFNIDLGDMDLGSIMPRTPVAPRNYQGFSRVRAGVGPKLGLSVQDTDDGKGVKILNVDDESNAEKAGLKEDDLITEIDGKAVNSADEVAKIIRESKDKVSVQMKLKRAGKTQTIEVKIPRKLKTADL